MWPKNRSVSLFGIFASLNNGFMAIWRHVSQHCKVFENMSYLKMTKWRQFYANFGHNILTFMAVNRFIINFRTSYWAKFFHFIGFTNVIWDCVRFWDFRPFFGSQKSKIALFCDFLHFLHQNGAITGQKLKIWKIPT